MDPQNYQFPYGQKLYLKNLNEFLYIKHNKNNGDYDILLNKDESLKDEEYKLNIIDEEIKINFADKSGLSYALNSLFQLLVNSKITSNKQSFTFGFKGERNRPSQSEE